MPAEKNAAFLSMQWSFKLDRQRDKSISGINIFHCYSHTGSWNTVWKYLSQLRIPRNWVVLLRK